MSSAVMPSERELRNSPFLTFLFIPLESLQEPCHYAEFPSDQQHDIAEDIIDEVLG